MATVEPMIGALCCGILMLALAGCGKKDTIQVKPEEWQTISPGKPLTAFPTTKVIEEGKGAPVEVGQLVKVNLRLHAKGPSWHDQGNWWIWIGFLDRKETPFFSNSPEIASALIGMREGTVLEFVDPTRSTEKAGSLETNLMGDQPNYRWRKNLEEDHTPIYMSLPGDSGSQIKILLTCKAELQRRSVHLYDDSPLRVGTGWFSAYTTNTPRELWFDEGRVQGKCSDGHTATFRYGPSKSDRNDKLPIPVVTGYFDQWLYEEWKRLPVGVQIDNNRPPVVPDRSSKINADIDKPLKIDVLAGSSDPDGNRLTARIIAGPSHGTLTANADGSYTYMPNKGWSGIDEFRYKVSDGMTESERGIWEVNVAR
jgi:hypothetical protein